MANAKGASSRQKNNGDGSVTLVLKEPIQYGEERIEDLTLKKPKAKHLKKLKLDDLSVEDLLLLAGNLAAQPPSVMDELAMPDFFAVIQVVENFLDDSAWGGKTV